MEHRITDIHCPQCGAPADFDIVRQMYVCGHCGGTVGISEAQKEKQGFRKLQREKLKNSVKKYRLFSTSCSGCGAEVVFEENEALSGCPFCGRSLVRTEYLSSKNMPESVIPFGITQKEACERLEDWCRKNRGKQEAKQLLPLIPELKGFYLPYELVRGPVHMRASRMDAESVYRCEGFMENAFVNCSKQLDNLLLDGMEPFDLNGLTEFEFGYVAGHHVKTPDINGKDLEQRVCQEVEECYTPSVRKTLETKAVSIKASAESAITMPVLLPVYYICKGDLMAAVNGQTGKVSVRADYCDACHERRRVRRDVSVWNEPRREPSDHCSTRILFLYCLALLLQRHDQKQLLGRGGQRDLHFRGSDFPPGEGQTGSKR